MVSTVPMGGRGGDRGGGRAAGVCYDFQRGRCNRGSSCRFSHEVASTTAAEEAAGCPTAAAAAMVKLWSLR